MDTNYLFNVFTIIKAQQQNHVKYNTKKDQDKSRKGQGWTDAKRTTYLFLGPTFSQYYNAIVGLMMTFLFRSSKIRDLEHLGHTRCSKNKLDGQRPEDCLFGSMLKLIKFLRNYIYRAYTIIVDI